jgi:hypothetical protein
LGENTAVVGDWASLQASHLLSNRATPRAGQAPDPGPWFALVWFWPAAWCAPGSAAATDGWAGRLALLRELPQGGEEGPARLGLTEAPPKLWLATTRVAAWCPADCLAGASPDEDAAALKALWAALTIHKKLPQDLDQLAAALHNARKGS